MLMSGRGYVNEGAVLSCARLMTFVGGTLGVWL